MSSDASALFRDPVERKLLKDAIKFLVSHQFVASRLLPDRLWKVDCGTGMGLPMSGEVADAALLHRAERALGAQLRHYKIRWVRRYRDDLIGSYLDTNLFRQWLALYRSHARYFRIKVEDVSFYKVQFLNFWILVKVC